MCKCEKCEAKKYWPSGLPRNPDKVLMENHPDQDQRRWPSGQLKHPSLLGK